jgi:hypothetical protein
MDWLSWGQVVTAAGILLVCLFLKWIQGEPIRRARNAAKVLDAIRSLAARGESPTSYRIVCEIESNPWKQMGHGTVHRALSDLIGQGRVICTEVPHEPLNKHDPPRRFVYSERHSIGA